MKSNYNKPRTPGTAPAISVLMSVHNGADYLNEAIDSVLAQTWTDFEFLIFDDGSTDKTPIILSEYTDDRIVVIRREINQGLTKNLIEGVNRARGDYIARMDADDICMPTRLEKQIAYLESNTDVGFLGTAVKFFDGKGYQFVATQPTNHDEIKCTLLFGYTMLHPTVMMRRSTLEKYGLNYDPAFPCSQDHDLWVRGIRYTRFANLAEPLLNIRIHAGQIGKTRRPQQVNLSNIVRYRQIEELLINIDDQTFDAFNRIFQDGVTHNTKIDFIRCDAFLHDILKTNAQKRIYDQGALEKIASDKFRAACKTALKSQNQAGTVFWFSKTKSWGDKPIREIAVFGILTSICIPSILKKIPARLERKIKLIRSIDLKEAGCSPLSLLRLPKNSGRTVLIIEPNAYHGETLPSYIHYFKQLGYQTVLICRRVNLINGCLSRLPPSERPAVYTMSPKAMRIAMRLRSVETYDWILITSAHISIKFGYFGLFLDFVGTTKPPPNKILMVEHCFWHIIPYIHAGRFQPKHIFLLTEITKGNINLAMLNPCYFGDWTQSTRNASNSSKIIFITVGSIEKRNRNFEELTKAIEFMERKPGPDFEIRIIGRGASEETFPNRSSKIRLLGCLSFQELFAELDSAHFYLPLLDPDNEGHRRYLNGETTGSRQLILGFSKVPVIHAEFAKHYGFSNNTAHIYTTGGLGAAMQAALLSTDSDYTCKVEALTRMKTAIMSASIQNLATVINPPQLESNDTSSA